LPTVHKPKVNLCSGCGEYLSFDMIQLPALSSAFQVIQCHLGELLFSSH
jgi:hypothetical protein